MTFLFTDVEGSTGAWLRNPQAMGAALMRHDELIERLVAAHGGQVVRPRGEGDSRFAVFTRASEAVTAACAIQLALLRERWPLPEPLRVRMAVHTGEADLRLGDYYGPAVNHCARLRAVAHGGQVLVSAVTVELVREALPTPVRLRDLGQHQLKDLEQPERVWQVLHPEMPADFPPLTSLSVRRNNLPNPLSSFVGRDQAIAELCGLLESARLVTLTGPGGIGKTRLAQRVAAEAQGHFPDGVWLVRLDSLAHNDLVPAAIAAVLGIREQPGQSLLATVTDAVGSRHLLLVLDNCEHLVQACAEVSDVLLQACPRLQFLATSREALGLQGEISWRVSPLSLPGTDTEDALAESEAARLFIERARAVQPGFMMIGQNASAIAEVCRRLDGLPLAIELAAARMKALSVEQLARRLDERFRLLTGGSRAALPRQQTLRAAIDWSYDLLSESEQVLFRQLGVFVGGWTLEAAEAVCAVESILPDDIIDRLCLLVDKSLVSAGEPTGERYRFLETIRQYALERLEAHQEGDAVRRRHADYFVALGEQAMPELNAGREHARWLERLARERDNLRTAMRWCVEAGQVDDGLQLAGAVWRFWLLEGTHSEREEWLQAIVKLASGVAPPALRARALNGAGPLAIRQGDLELAQTLLDKGLAIARELHDLHGIAFCLHNLGALAACRADFAKAWTLLEEAVVTWRNAGDRRREVITLSVLAGYVAEQGDYARARARYANSLAVYLELRDEKGVANAQALMGLMAFLDGDVAEAQTLCESSLQLARKVGHRATIAWTCLDLALVRLHVQDYGAAQQLCVESLLLRDSGDQAQGRVAAALGVLAGIATATDQSERALRLFGASEQCLGASNTLFPFFVRLVRERWQTHASRVVGKDAAVDALSWGRALSPEEAVAYALEAVPADN